jgi:hypothetical protein
VAQISTSLQTPERDKTVFIVDSTLDITTGAILTAVRSSSGPDDFGIVLARGTPDEVIKKLNAEGGNVATNPDFVFLFTSAINIVTQEQASLISQFKQLVPPPTTEPVPPAAVVTPNPNDLNGTAAGDDSSYDKLEAARLNNAKSNSTSDSTTNPNTETSSQTQSFPSATQNGQAGSGTASSSNVAENDPSTKPGIRPYNPLSSFSSYNYQISLYMISPDAYNVFVRSGKTNLVALASTDPSNTAQGTGGVYLIAQSGGQGTDIPRAPGFELDFYIDNVKIKSSISSKASTTASLASDIRFNMYEPYGFSLPTKLKLAGAALNKNSSISNVGQVKNPTRNFYILGIKFLGYDSKGELLKPTNPQDGFFETYYDIVIKEFKFKLNGNVTVYDIAAAPIPTTVGFGAKRGRVSTGLMVSGETVENALIGPDGLLTKLNSQQQQLVNQSGNTRIGTANKYKVEFVGPNADKIKNANLITDVDKKNKQIWPMSDAATKAQVTDFLSVKSNPSNTSRSLSFGKDISVQQAISGIISTSDYLTKALKLSFKNDIDTMTGKDNKDSDPGKEEVKWYNLSCSVECLAWDNILGDFAYEITYWIMVYDTPNIVSAYTAKTPKYYGAYKKYDYWFTGKNSEIIGYEQSINNSYYIPVVVPTGSSASQAENSDVPIAPMQQTNENRTGGLNLWHEAQNNYLTNLYDPGSFSLIKIEIMGDPDFLVSDNPVTSTSQYRQFYGSNGYTVNPNTGQVFIEVNFKEGIDYDNKSGVMSLNENILFYQNPNSVPKGLKGISFMIVTVESSFSSGKFTQVLECNINIFPKATETSSTASQEYINTRGLAVYDEEGRLSTLKRNPETGELYTPLVAPKDTVGFVQDMSVTIRSEGSALPNDSNQVNLGYTTGESQQTSPTGGGSGVADSVAGGVTAQAGTSTKTKSNPNVSKKVANDDAASGPVLSKNVLEGRYNGRETAVREFRNRYTKIR